jgi:hypothetical protein
MMAKRVIPLLLAMGCLGAGQPGAAPKFAGKSIPDPPRQKEPWTPPQTRLPRFLVSATTALFEQGVADPRGCEYREVEIGDRQPAKTRGFVLPQREGETDRFVVSWEGVIYPAVSVGQAVDLEKDVREDVETLRRQKGAGGRVPRRTVPEVLRVCLLLRLGRADLAEEQFAASTSWTPEAKGRDLTDYGISYLTLAQEWASIVFLRLIYAHMRGDDAIALDADRRLSAFAPRAEAKAKAMGFEREVNRFSQEPPSYFSFLRQLPELLADQERRAKEPPRGPIPPHGGDPAARVAALIRELDQIAHPQMTHFGNAPHSPLVGLLIGEGEAAVEPLLAAIENDTRLTRTTTQGRGISIDHHVHPVFEPEVIALRAILNTDQFVNAEYRARDGMAARKELAKSMRDFWNKNRAVPLTERWYRTLRDDRAGLRQWKVAAARIVQPADAGPPFIASAIIVGPPSAEPGTGEVLRSRRDPSVSQLMARRALEAARHVQQRTVADVHLEQACDLAMMLHRWDPQAALPVLRELTTLTREVIERNRSERHDSDPDLVRFIGQFSILRVQAGERNALAEYAAEIRNEDSQFRHNLKLQLFEPMWTYPDVPAIRDTAHWLFNDPQSPWTSLLQQPGSRTYGLLQNADIYSSPLLSSPGFREGVLAALTIKSEMGTVRRDVQNLIESKTNDGLREVFRATATDLEDVKPNVALPFRICDYIAAKISAVEGSPRCELFWPVDQRDQAIEACAAYLKRYGDRFTAKAPIGEPETPGSPRELAHLAFPKLDRPATPDDVRATRAIFSLQREGEVRLVDVGAMPIRAQWNKIDDDSQNSEHFDLEVRRKLNQQGWIWQAEEVRKGDRWERYYGFVAHHVIARVPAAEMEAAADHRVVSWGRLANGLDVRIESAAKEPGYIEPGQPIVVNVRVRNRRGVENASPREFLQRGTDGRLAMRRGVTLSASYWAPTRNGAGRMAAPKPAEELKPKRTDRFDPGAAARPLAAFAEFGAMQLNLNDWFDLSRPGTYFVRLTFTADSGVGEGTSNDWHFSVGEPENPFL